MKNGAHVRWKGCKEFVEHYDCLPNMKCAGLEQHQFKIEEVYAGKEASISHLGFRHFRSYSYINIPTFNVLIFTYSIYTYVFRYLPTL